MKRFGYVLLVPVLFFVFTSCGNKAVKPSDTTASTSQTNTTQTQKVEKEKTYSVYGKKLDDTAYSNVIQVFKAAVTAEKESPIPKNIYGTGEATILLIKFFKENLSVKRYGFTQDDIDTYKVFAKKKFSDVLQNEASSAELKDGAQKYLIKLENM